MAHVGVASRGLHPGTQIPGALCRAAQQSGSGNYLANMVLYPGRFEFFEYLPDNIQVSGRGVTALGTGISCPSHFSSGAQDSDRRYDMIRNTKE